MRMVIAAAVLAAATASAFAQQRAPQRPPQSQGPAQAQPPAPPPIFPCRTATDVCFVAVVTGNSQVLVVFTNAPQTAGIEAKPIDVFSGDAPSAGASAAPLDLAQHLGRVVMLTGTYDPKAGLTKAELVEAAGPLLSFMIKMMGIEEPDAGQPPRGGRPQPQGRPRR
jgi:hypothetical protein